MATITEILKALEKFPYGVEVGDLIFYTKTKENMSLFSGEILTPIYMNDTETKKPSKHMQAALNQLTKQVEWFERKRAKLQDEIQAREKQIDELSTSIEYISEQIIKLKG